MKAIKPVPSVITNYTLTSGVDNEYPMWSETESVVEGDRRIRPDHHIYEALLDIGVRPRVGDRSVNSFVICAGEPGEHLIAYVDEEDFDRMKFRRAVVTGGGVTLTPEVACNIDGSNYGKLLAYDARSKVFAVVYGDSNDASCRVIGVKIVSGLPVMACSAVDLDAGYAAFSSLIYNPVNGRFIAVYTTASTYKLVAFGWDSVTSTFLHGTPVPVTGAGKLIFDGVWVWHIYAAGYTELKVSRVTVTGLILTAETERDITRMGFLESPQSIATGAGPRKCIISPDGVNVYATNNTDGTISIFIRDSSSGVLSGSTTIACAGAYGIAISSDGLFVYVTTSSAANTVRTYLRNLDTGALTFVTTIATGVNPQGIVISPLGTSVYVCNYGSSSLSIFARNVSTGVLSGSTTVVVGTNPKNLISTETEVYYTNYGAATVERYLRNPATGGLSSRAAYACGTAPVGLAISGDEKNVYVVNSGSNTVTIFQRNFSTGVLSGATTISTGTTPQEILCDSSGDTVYVTNSGSNNVSVYRRTQSTGLLTWIAAPSCGVSPAGLCESFWRDHLYVVSNGDNICWRYYAEPDIYLDAAHYDSNAARILITYTSGHCRVVAITISAITIGNKIIIDHLTYGGYPRAPWGIVYDPAAHRFIVCFTDTSDAVHHDAAKSFTATVSGYTISFGALCTMTTDDTDSYAGASFDVVSGQVVYAYQVDSDTGLSYGYVGTGKISGTDVVFTGVQTPPEQLLTSTNGITQWLDLGTTNAYAMMDGIISHKTTTAGATRDVGETDPDIIQWTDSPGVFDSLALMSLDAASVTVTIKTAGGTTRYTATTDVRSKLAFVLPELPITVSSTDKVTITVTGHPAPVYTATIGEYKIGTAEDLGGTQKGYVDNFESYSSFDTDTYGNITVIPRPYSYNSNVVTKVENTQVQRVEKFFEDYKDTPLVYVPSDVPGYEHMARYGFHRKKKTTYEWVNHSLISFEILSVV